MAGWPRGRGGRRQGAAGGQRALGLDLLFRPSAVVEVAEETGSFSTEDDEEEEAYVGAVAQDANAVADMEEADGVAATDGPTTAMSWTEYVVAYKRGYPSPRSISSCLGHGSPLSPRICTRIWLPTAPLLKRTSSARQRITSMARTAYPSCGKGCARSTPRRDSSLWMTMRSPRGSNWSNITTSL